MDWKQICTIALGSAFGGVARAGVGTMFRNWEWPWATLLVNLVGSFLIGLLAGSMGESWSNRDHWIRNFAAVGFLGGFTTFSTFSLESVELIRKGEWGIWMGSVGLQVSGGMILAALGLVLGSRLSR